MTQVIKRASPNWNARPSGVLIDTLVIHATESPDAQQDLAWLCNPKSEASAHALIDRDGTIYDLVPVQHRAWHAGKSIYNGRPDVNDFSIGVELANRCDGKEPYTDEQLQTFIALAVGYAREWPAITPERITTHKAIRAAWLAAHPGTADPKPDPGPCFPLDDFIAAVKEELGR